MIWVFEEAYTIFSEYFGCSFENYSPCLCGHHTESAEPPNPIWCHRGEKQSRGMRGFAGIVLWCLCGRVWLGKGVQDLASANSTLSWIPSHTIICPFPTSLLWGCAREQTMAHRIPVAALMLVHQLVAFHVLCDFGGLVKLLWPLGWDRSKAHNMCTWLSHASLGTFQADCERYSTLT